MTWHSVAANYLLICFISLKQLQIKTSFVKASVTEILQASTKVFLDRLVNTVLIVGIFLMWIFLMCSLEYHLDFIYIIYFIVTMWGPYFILKMIKKLLMGLFGLYFMGVYNNKTNIFHNLLGKKSCSFFKFLFIFPVNSWMQHHNGNIAIVVGDLLSFDPDHRVSM